MAVERQVMLHFAAAPADPAAVSDLSAVCRDGAVLWIAGDELPVLYRLRLGGDEPGYRTFFLDLDGLGVRDLGHDGDDVLVLAGPTMDLDGPARVYRWRGAAPGRHHTAVRQDDLVRLEDLPAGHGDDEGRDHAEGLTVLPDGAAMVVYDSPAPDRVQGGGVLADVVGLHASPPHHPAVVASRRSREPVESRPAPS
jgi:hypothetical protein